MMEEELLQRRVSSLSFILDATPCLVLQVILHLRIVDPRVCSFPLVSGFIWMSLCSVIIYTSGIFVLIFPGLRLSNDHLWLCTSRFVIINMSTSFGVIGGDDTQDFLELVQAKDETASKRKLDADQLYMVRTLHYPDRSMRELSPSYLLRSPL